MATEMTTLALFSLAALLLIREGIGEQVPCLVGMCTARHSQMLDEQGTAPSASADYCILLKDYMACLNDSFGTCLAQLDFHSAITAATQRWRKFKCHKFELSGKQNHKKCAFWVEQEEENKDVDSDVEEDGEEQEGNGPYVCALFGQLELSAFHSVHTIEQCTFTGARPLFDNRFFLIQVTGAEFIDRNSSQPIDKPVHAISKAKMHFWYENHQFHMALIVRPREGCVPAQKVYIADAADPGPLPSAFQDGTNHVTEESSSRNAVEILSFDDGARVDILLIHLATTIRVRKFANKFLNIFIRAPRRLLDMDYEAKSLCMDGCWESAKEFKQPKNGQNHHQETCEQKNAKEDCSKLLEDRARFQEEWMALCVYELAGHSLPSMAPIWAQSLRLTLDDVLGISGTIQSEKKTNWTTLTNQLGNSGCPLLVAKPSPIPLMDSSTTPNSAHPLGAMLFLRLIIAITASALLFPSPFS